MQRNPGNGDTGHCEDPGLILRIHAAAGDLGGSAASQPSQNW